MLRLQNNNMLINPKMRSPREMMLQQLIPINSSSLSFWVCISFFYTRPGSPITENPQHSILSKIPLVITTIQERHARIGIKLSAAPAA